MAESSQRVSQFFNVHYDEDLLISDQEINPTNSSPTSITPPTPKKRKISEQDNSPQPLKGDFMKDNDIHYLKDIFKSPPALNISPSIDEDYWKRRKANCDLFRSDPRTKPICTYLIMRALQIINEVSFAVITGRKSTSIVPPTLLYNCTGAIISAIEQTPFGWYMSEGCAEKEFHMWVGGEYGAPDYVLTDAQKNFRLSLLMNFKKEMQKVFTEILDINIEIFFVGKYKSIKKENKK